ncbi:MAG TPA: four-carbon acid sugar kinase family protein [Paraburkholderia sp.]|nr:four-carbon acid sugar kinase family protein [Paraburkholderia sp.]
MSLLIVADDLSGAADSAIAFANAGRRTLVALDAHEAAQASASDAAVIALDTDSRRLEPAAAGQRAAQAWLALRGNGARRKLYKKIDSTLRGNWVAEVAALQPAVGMALVAPAFPATGRTVRDGRVYVRGVPLGETETWQLEHAGRTADLQPMLEAAGLRTARLAVELLRGAPQTLAQALADHSRNGVQALIVDAETESDLNLLARVSAALDAAFFWVGSGGLARELAALPDLFDSAAPASAAPERRDGPILTLVGSLSAVSVQQCALLRERTGMTELTIPPTVLRDGAAHPDSAAWQASIGARVAAGVDLLVRIGRDDAFDPAEGAQLSAALAALVEPHLAHLAGLIATGGETARAMLAAARIGRLELLSEVEPGVAVARPADAARQLTIVTKAGAFGSEHALYGAWLHLRGQQEQPAASVSGVQNAAAAAAQERTLT